MIVSYTVLADSLEAIPNLARDVKLANVDTFVVTRAFPNGTFLVVPSPHWMEQLGADTDLDGSRNCTKHNCRCPYMDMPVQEERAATPEKADLLWTPEIEAEIERWQQTGSFPFPDLYIYPAPSPQFFSFEDLRLIHHVASVSSELGIHDASNFTIWTRQVPL